MKDISAQAKDTNSEFETVLGMCRALFAKKLHDYGAAWRILRQRSVTDQILIKAERSRSLQDKGVAMVDEDEADCFMAIINYGIVGLIQIDKGAALADDINEQDALALYDRYAEEAKALMVRKNHDYGEAWRRMRVSSYTDLILMKLARTKQIENLGGVTLVSEGVDANYMDMINYSAFALIKLKLEA